VSSARLRLDPRKDESMTLSNLALGARVGSARRAPLRRRWPPDSAPICVRRWSSMWTCSSASRTARRSSGPGRRTRPGRQKRPIMTTSSTVTGKAQSTSSACGT
jgi:hypothetical protein